ncbi:hypothetical protein [Leucobacter aridicollis]|uniref:Anti-sigma factor n=1 Tax=Leucobacter aridicollis TaxID=283878 RepID=A0A852RHK1_9MICO|nr:hypothetical protein [Leucobacter aridicollis]NYD28330.1 hypothetical protein [Leucobacter aridicollis]
MAPTRRRVAPAVAMTMAVLGAVTLSGAATIQLRADANARAADAAHAAATERVRERLLATPGLLAGVLANDVPRMDSFEVLEVTPEGVAAYALITNDDVLVIGLASPFGEVASSSSPGMQRNSIFAPLDAGDGSRAYDLTVWRAGAGYGHELIVQ